MNPTDVPLVTAPAKVRVFDKNEEIKQGLRNSGVPDYAFATTLLKEKSPDLRSLVESDILIHPTSPKGLYLYPDKGTSYTQTRKLFYLTAKELFLRGSTVFCIPLPRVAEALLSDDLVGDALKIERVRNVFVLDFYEKGAENPLTQTETSRIRTWVRARFDSGKSVSFLSDAPVDKCATWWSPSLLNFISTNVESRAV